MKEVEIPKRIQLIIYNMVPAVNNLGYRALNVLFVCHQKLVVTWWKIQLIMYDMAITI